jgi:quercetin dioxygenase-like cupin family protein
MPSYDDGSESPLKTVHCFITTHTADGKAIFHDPRSGTEELTLQRKGPAAFNVHYTTDTVPVKYENDKDLTTFYDQPRPVPIALKNGSVLRMVDLAPGEQSPMHATNSLDYGVVLEGEIILILEDYESGPRRTMTVGDVSVQRGTMHAWRNASSENWARMLYVLLDAEVPGREKEDWGGIELPK